MEIKLEDKDIRSILAKEFNCDVDDIVFSTKEDYSTMPEITRINATIVK